MFIYMESILASWENNSFNLFIATKPFFFKLQPYKFPYKYVPGLYVKKKHKCLNAKEQMKTWCWSF